MDTKELIKILKSSPSVLIRYAAERLQEQERIISSLSNKEEKHERKKTISTNDTSAQAS